MEAGLVPAATAVLAFREPPPGTATAEGEQAGLKPFARELLAAGAGDEHAAPPLAFPTCKDSGGGSSSVGGGSKVAPPPEGTLTEGSSSGRGGGAGGSTADGSANGGGRSMPKWLKR